MKVDENAIRVYAGHESDHLPMTDADWAFAEWSLAQIHNSAWREPWIVSFEYGGVSALWEAATDAAVLEKDVPKLGEMVKGTVT
jgi:hypothetical protein